MPRRCTVCDDPERGLIDRRLAGGGESVRAISRHYSLTLRAVQNHRARHLPVALAKARDAAEIARADTLLAQVDDLRRRALGVLERAEAAEDLRAATAAIREARCCVELLAKLAGELKERGGDIVVRIMRYGDDASS